MWLSLMLNYERETPVPLTAWALSCIYYTYAPRGLLNPYMLHHPTCCLQLSPPPLFVTLPPHCWVYLESGMLELDTDKICTEWSSVYFGLFFFFFSFFLNEGIFCTSWLRKTRLCLLPPAFPLHFPSRHPSLTWKSSQWTWNGEVDCVEHVHWK